VEIWTPIQPTKLRASDPHIGGWKMPLEFHAQAPVPARGPAQSAKARETLLRGIAAELKADGKVGQISEPGDDAKGTYSRWAILEKQARSPEKFFGLRDMEVEVRVVNDGTAQSMRDPKQQVVVSTIWARYNKGYRWVKRGAGAGA
jgi:hypothetical protein